MATVVCRPGCGPNTGTAMAQPTCGCPAPAQPIPAE
jgi:hypothetical protein